MNDVSNNDLLDVHPSLVTIQGDQIFSIMKQTLIQNSSKTLLFLLFKITVSIRQLWAGTSGVRERDMACLMVLENSEFLQVNLFLLLVFRFFVVEAHLAQMNKFSIEKIF